MDFIFDSDILLNKLNNKLRKATFELGIKSYLIFYEK